MRDATDGTCKRINQLRCRKHLSPVVIPPPAYLNEGCNGWNLQANKPAKMPKTFESGRNSTPSGNDARSEHQKADSHHAVLVSADTLAITLCAIFSHKELPSTLLHVDPTFLLAKSSHLQSHIFLDLSDTGPVLWNSTYWQLCVQFTRPQM
uniref:Collagen triple helix repeat protein n=1 Tax=Parascaris univalens TaxID=6257 RepID=A0A915BLM9_PARUN